MSDKTKLIDRITKALDGTSGDGSEMCPTEVRNEIIRLVREKSWVRQLVGDGVIEMSMRTVKIPKFSSGITMYSMDDDASSEPTESQHGTTEVQLDMKTIIAKVPIKKKLLAYAIPALERDIYRDIADYLAYVEADIVVNGDTTSGASNINGTLSTGDVKLIVTGLREQNFNAVAASEVSNVDASGTTLTLSHIRQAIANMGVPGRDPADLVLLVPNCTRADMLGWEELETVDKHGPDATIITGMIGKVYGIPVICTSVISQGMNSSGVVASGSSLTAAILMNRRTMLLGVPTMAERQFMIDLERKPGLDQINLYPKEDLAFAVRYREQIVQIYNVATA